MRWIGFIFALFTGISALFALYVDRIERRLGPRTSLIIIIGMQAVIYFLMVGQTSWIALAVLIALLKNNRNFAHLLQSEYENRLIPSRIRATVLSSASFLRNSLFGSALILWGYGWSLDRNGIYETLIMAGYFVLVLGTFMLFYFPSIKRRDNNTENCGEINQESKEEVKEET